MFLKLLLWTDFVYGYELIQIFVSVWIVLSLIRSPVASSNILEMNNVSPEPVMKSAHLYTVVTADVMLSLV